MENNTIKILGLSLFGRNGASSRYRLYQYIPFLKEKGIEITVYPLISDSSYEIFMGVRKTYSFLMPFIKFYLISVSMIKRFFHILKAGSYDTVFIQKDILPALYFYILKKLNSNIIFDLDDAIYESHSTVKPSLFSFEYLFFQHRKNNLDRILKYAKAVTVTVPYLAEYVRKYNGNVHVITGPIDCSLYNYDVEGNTHSEKIIIGWIGSPVTTKYIEDILPVFKKLKESYPDVEIHLIGARKIETQELNIKFREWSEKSEIEMLSEFDIGIMPLTDDKWSKGKGGLKILQYFASGIPVVCSPVGINKDLVEEGVSGFFAKSENDWVEKLSLLINNRELRKKTGGNGKKLVELKFDLKKSVTYIEDIIRNAVQTSEDAAK